LLEVHVLLAEERVLNFDLSDCLFLALLHLYLELLGLAQLVILATDHILRSDRTFIKSLNRWLKSVLKVPPHEVTRCLPLQVFFTEEYVTQVQVELRILFVLHHSISYVLDCVAGLIVLFFAGCFKVNKLIVKSGVVHSGLTRPSIHDIFYAGPCLFDKLLDF